MRWKNDLVSYLKLTYEKQTALHEITSEITDADSLKKINPTKMQTRWILKDNSRSDDVKKQQQKHTETENLLNTKRSTSSRVCIRVCRVLRTNILKHTILAKYFVANTAYWLGWYFFITPNKWHHFMNGMEITT